jgi:pyochelin biosynthetic protein PchC
MGRAAAADLLELSPAPCVLFGHSLGALVAYEAAVALHDAGVEPVMLCVSGSAAPHLAAGGTTYAAPDAEFWRILCELGGVDPEVAHNTEVRDVVLPTLRSDVRASETYQPRDNMPVLSCAVRCYHGLGDPLVDDAYVDAWASTTTGRFSICRREGAHFHIEVRREELVADVLGWTLRAIEPSAAPDSAPMNAASPGVST